MATMETDVDANVHKRGEAAGTTSAATCTFTCRAAGLGRQEPSSQFHPVRGTTATRQGSCDVDALRYLYNDDGDGDDAHGDNNDDGNDNGNDNNDDDAHHHHYHHYDAFDAYDDSHHLSNRNNNNSPFHSCSCSPPRPSPRSLCHRARLAPSSPHNAALLLDSDPLQPTVYDRPLQSTAKDDFFQASSDALLDAFGVGQEAQPDPLLSALTTLSTSSTLADCQFDDIDAAASASRSSLVASPGSNQQNSFPSNPSSERMAAAAANVLVPQTLPLESRSALHLSDALAPMDTSVDVPFPDALQYDLVTASPDTSQADALRNTARTTDSKRPSLADRADGGLEAEVDKETGEAKKKRPRGRPRLEVDDESTGRRRTQVRNAQRTHRQREKMYTIALQRKVEELETAADNMSKELSDLQKTLLADRVLDAAPHTAHRLKMIADRFLASVSLAKEGGVDHTSEASSRLSGEMDTSPVVARPQQQRPLGDNANGPATLSFLPSAPVIHMPASLTYEVVTQSTPDNASFPFYASMEPTPHDYMVQMANPAPFPPTIPAPSSYAAQEVTFGRRLQQASTEASLRLITMPNPPAEKYAAVFGLCLFFESREAIACRLRSFLCQTQQESASYWKAPMTGSHGDGTFPPKGKSGAVPWVHGADNGSLHVGNQVASEYGRQEETTGFSMSRFSAEVEAAEAERLDHRMRMMCPRLEEDLLDADAVEAYLCRLGIVIPQSVDFVEADIVVSDLDNDSTRWDPTTHGTNVTKPKTFAYPGFLPSDSGYGSFSGPARGGMWPGSSPESEGLSPSASADAAMTVGQSMAPVFNGGVTSGASDINGGLAAFTFTPDLNDMWASAANFWPQTKVSIDVNMLVNELVHKVVCLGRGPEIRRRDVNRAVKIAAGLAPAEWRKQEDKQA